MSRSMPGWRSCSCGGWPDIVVSFTLAIFSETNGACRQGFRLPDLFQQSPGDGLIEPVVTGPVRWLLRPSDRGSKRETVGPIDRFHLVPAERHGNRRTLARPRRKRSDGGRTALITQIVDKELALARGLRERRSETLRFLARQQLCKTGRKILDLGPCGAADQRSDDVNALAARDEREGFKPHIRQPGTNI